MKNTTEDKISQAIAAGGLIILLVIGINLEKWYTAGKPQRIADKISHYDECYYSKSCMLSLKENADLIELRELHAKLIEESQPEREPDFYYNPQTKELQKTDPQCSNFGNVWTCKVDPS